MSKHQACEYKHAAVISLSKNCYGGLSASEDAAPLLAQWRADCTRCARLVRPHEGPLIKPLSTWSAQVYGGQHDIHAFRGERLLQGAPLFEIAGLTSTCHTCSLLCARRVSPGGQGLERGNLLLKMVSSAEGYLLHEPPLCCHPLLLWRRRLCWDGRCICDSTWESLEAYGSSCAVTDIVTGLLGLSGCMRVCPGKTDGHAA